MDWEKQLSIYNGIFNRQRSVSFEENRRKILFGVRKNFTGLNVAEIIKTIKKNNHTDTSLDNEVIINFLNGDKKCIWLLHKRYHKLYKFFLFKNKNLWERQGDGIEIDLDEIIIEMFMEIIQSIVFGKYKGIHFKNYSLSFFRIFLLKRLKKYTRIIKLN